MISPIGFVPPVLVTRPGTLESFEQHVDEWVNSIEKGNEIVSKQIRPISDGSYGFIHTGNYEDIITGKTLINFHPFFPDHNFIASQIKAVSYDLNLVPLPLPYPDITTGTPVGKYNYVNNPPPVGKNLNTTA